MRWLVTVKRGVDLGALAALVESAGGSSAAADPIPLGDDEIVVEIEATKEAAQRLARDASVISVHPSSDYTLY